MAVDAELKKFFFFGKVELLAHVYDDGARRLRKTFFLFHYGENGKKRKHTRPLTSILENGRKKR